MEQHYLNSQPKSIPTPSKKSFSVNRLGELIDAGAELGILQKSGSWFSYGEQRLGQGRDQARESLDQAPILRHAIEEAILRKMGLDYLDAGTQAQRIRPNAELSQLQAGERKMAAST